MRSPKSSSRKGASFADLVTSFADPPLRYRPLQIIHDFSFWTRGGVSPEEVVALLIERGLGGAVVNVAWGDDYLSNQEDWRLLAQGVKRLCEKGLTVWLYDEKGYPSGVAGGRVLEGHPEREAVGVFCHAVCCRSDLPEGRGPVEAPLPAPAREWVHCVALPVVGRMPELSRAVHVPFSPKAPVRWTAPEGDWLLLCFATKRLFEGTIAGGEFGWSDEAYVNLLTTEATEAFCRLTHHAYAERLADCWDDIEAIFTDEPALQSAYVMFDRTPAEAPAQDGLDDFVACPHSDLAASPFPAAIPWESRLPEWFRTAKGYPVRDALPALFFDLPGTRSLRYDFYDVISQRLADSYLGVIRKHCDALGIASSGHLLAEDHLHQHVVFEGDLYKSLRRFHIPGVDMLYGKPETIMSTHLFTIPKLAASVARVTGAPRAMIEHFDFCERHGWIDPWPLSMEERLATLGILFALGIDTMISYMPFHTIGSPLDPRLKPRRPTGASPFGPEYRQWTDCAGRLAQLVAGGDRVCDLAVYYPIEAVQANLLPWPGHVASPYTEDSLIKPIESAYIETCRRLLAAQRDFDIVDDDALREEAFRDSAMDIAGHAYRVLVLTHAPVIPLAVAEALVAFVRAGGVLVLVGREPEGPVEADADEAFRRAWQSLSDANVIRVPGPDGVCQAVASFSKHRLRLSPPAPEVLALHTRHPGRDTWLLVNTTESVLHFSASFPVSGDALLFRPITGAYEQITPPDGELQVTLDGYDMIAVAFPRNVDS